MSLEVFKGMTKIFYDYGDLLWHAHSMPSTPIYFWCNCIDLFYFPLYLIIPAYVLKAQTALSSLLVQLLPPWITIPVLIYGCIFLVPSRLRLLLMQSSLPDCGLVWLNWWLLVIMNIIKDIIDKIYHLSPTKDIRSVIFSLLDIRPTRDSPIATDSQIMWWQNELLFFLKTDSGLDVRCITDMLSP